MAAARAVRVGPTVWKPWEHWRVTRPALSALDVFIAHDAQKRPLVVLLQGSGCDPLFSVTDLGGGNRRGASSLIFGDLVEGRLPRAHFAAVEKRGVVSFGPYRRPDEKRTPCSSDYEAGVHKRERVRDIVDAIDALSREPWVGPVLVAGHSEGGDLAAGVAQALRQRLAAVAIFGSAGPSQLVDFVIYAHRTGRVEALREAFSEIQTVIDPKSQQPWRGHSLVRWRSHGVESTPLDEMRSCEVPTFVAHGSADTSSPVESADTFVVELLRSNPARHVFYLRVQDADHGLGTPDGQGHLPFAFDRFLSWSLSPNKRGVLVGPPL